MAQDHNTYENKLKKFITRIWGSVMFDTKNSFLQLLRKIYFNIHTLTTINEQQLENIGSKFIMHTDLLNYSPEENEFHVDVGRFVSFLYKSVNSLENENKHLLNFFKKNFSQVFEESINNDYSECLINPEYYNEYDDISFSKGFNICTDSVTLNKIINDVFKSEIKDIPFKNKRIIGAGVIIVSRDNKILLVRDRNKQYGDIWSFPKGKREYIPENRCYETSLETAIRECKEEIFFDFYENGYPLTQRPIVSNSRSGSYYFYPCVIRQSDDMIDLKKYNILEIDQIRWFSLDEINQNFEDMNTYIRFLLENGKLDFLITRAIDCFLYDL